MEKPKIEEISSKEYTAGRIDRFFLSRKGDIHNQIISFLRSLGISEIGLEEFDFVTSDIEGYFFVFDNEIRIHLIILEDGINLIIDTQISKKNIINKLEKYFQIF